MDLGTSGARAGWLAQRGGDGRAGGRGGGGRWALRGEGHPSCRRVGRMVGRHRGSDDRCCPPPRRCRRFGRRVGRIQRDARGICGWRRGPRDCHPAAGGCPPARCGGCRLGPAGVARNRLPRPVAGGRCIATDQPRRQSAWHVEFSAASALAAERRRRGLASRATSRWRTCASVVVSMSGVIAATRARCSSGTGPLRGVRLSDSYRHASGVMMTDTSGSWCDTGYGRVRRT